MEHPLAEESQLGATIALPLQECQFSALPFDLPMTVGQIKGGLHRGLRTLYAAGEGHERWQAAGETMHEPWLERAAAARWRIIWRQRWGNV